MKYAATLPPEPAAVPEGLWFSTHNGHQVLMRHNFAASKWDAEALLAAAFAQKKNK